MGPTPRIKVCLLVLLFVEIWAMAAETGDQNCKFQLGSIHYNFSVFNSPSLISKNAYQQAVTRLETSMYSTTILPVHAVKLLHLPFVYILPTIIYMHGYVADCCLQLYGLSRMCGRTFRPIGSPRILVLG